MAALLLKGEATAREHFADCSLTASNLKHDSRAASPVSVEDTMRMTLACVLAICGTVLFTSPALNASTQAPQAEAQAPSKATINLNLATVDQLETLPGIGRKTAERIVEHRTKNGAFKKVEELMNVKGIGEKSFLKLKPMIVVTPLKPEKASGD